MNEEPMSKSERDELAKLVRRREKLAKADADAVASERLAAVEQELAAIYRIGDDEVWREAYAYAQQAVAEMNARVADRCRELGIREQFAPEISLGWYSRGENAAKERVTELRRVAKSRTDADVKATKAQIERASVDVQTQLVANGLRSEQARAFLESMPTAEQLMPALTVAELEEATPRSRWA